MFKRFNIINTAVKSKQISYEEGVKMLNKEDKKFAKYAGLIFIIFGVLTECIRLNNLIKGENLPMLFSMGVVAFLFLGFTLLYTNNYLIYHQKNGGLVSVFYLSLAALPLLILDILLTGYYSVLHVLFTLTIPLFYVIAKIKGIKLRKFLKDSKL